MIFVFWMLSFKPTFSLSSFTFIKRLFSSSSLSAIRVVSSAYLRLLIFLSWQSWFQLVLHPAQRFSWCTLHICKISRVTIYSFDVLLSLFGTSELKWTGMGKFNSDGHYIYYFGQESLRRNGVAIIVNKRFWNAVQFSSVAQSCPTLGNPMNCTSLSITNSRSSPKPMSIKSVMPSSHLILCRPLLLLPSIFPSIRVFSNESALCIRWPKYWSFSFNISPSNEHPGLISFRMDWLISLQSKRLSRVFSNTTVQKHQFFGTQLPL